MANKTKEAVMPSLFASLKSTESMPLASMNELERLVRHDSHVASLTMTYRKRMAISKQYADEIKLACPAISASLQYDGHGRSLDHVKAETLLIALDYDCDGATKEQMEAMWQAAINSAYTKVAYHTISNKGFRIILGYERSADCDLTIVELFNMMIRKALNFYNTLLGWEADQQATDIGRLCGLAHDPGGYFNGDAIPLRLSPIDLRDARNRIALEKKKKNKGGRPKGTGSKQKAAAAAAANAPTIEEVAPHIKELLARWGKSFEEHQHNEYVTSFAYCCLKYGIDEEKATQYAVSEFSQHYPETAGVMKSVYHHTELKGKWHFYRNGESYPAQASVRLIIQWLDQHYDFVRNMVTSKYEVTSRMAKDGKWLQRVSVTDDILHSIWTEMDLIGIHTSVQKLSDIIESDYSVQYDPFEEYLRSLPKWDGKDYLKELADRVQVEEHPGYYHSQKDFEEYLKKWFVSMVVAWVNPKVVNQTMLVLIGKGGLYKTTLLGAFLPPCLAEYYINDSTSNYLDKDMQEAYTCKALMNLDEFEATYGRNLSAFKSNMTKEKFSFRRPYDKFRSELMHRCSICGTSNEQHIITDVENRRFSPWIVSKIVSPREVPINYEGIYSQAVALGQSVSHGRERADGWVYWTTQQDIQQMRIHNRLFMVANYAEEQILKYLEIPDDCTAEEFIKLLTNAEILGKIATNPVLRQNLSNQSIGSIMSRLGFKSVHRRTGNCWVVKEKSGPEVAKYSEYHKIDIIEEDGENPL